MQTKIEEQLKWAAFTHCADIIPLDAATVSPKKGGASIATLKAILNNKLVLPTQRRIDEKSTEAG